MSVPFYEVVSLCGDSEVLTEYSGVSVYYQQIHSTLKTYPPPPLPKSVSYFDQSFTLIILGLLPSSYMLASLSDLSSLCV